MLHRVARQPVLAGVAGAACIATSAILVQLAAVGPATAAAFRCVYALPLLGLLAALERRRYGGRGGRERALALLAGGLLGADLTVWHAAIAAAGAGIATVLGNLQVVVVALAAWWLLGERPSRRLLVAVPVVLAGVVVISGVVGGGAYGADPVRGVLLGLVTSVAYAGFLLVQRQGARDLRRVAGPLFDATLAAAVVALLLGPVAGGVDLAPRWPAHGWLAVLALGSQTVGWLLISVSLPRLPAALTSLLLLLQPLAALLLAAAVLGERPSPVQLIGCAIVLAGVVWAARAPRPSPGTTSTPTPAPGPVATTDTPAAVPPGSVAPVAPAPRAAAGGPTR